MGGNTSPFLVPMRKSENNFVEWFMWVLGTKLRLEDLLSKRLFPRIHLAGPRYILITAEYSIRHHQFPQRCMNTLIGLASVSSFAQI